MSKKRQQFERSSGWQARDGDGPRKDPYGPSKRRDLSQGSQRMADGGSAGMASELRKQVVLERFKMWKSAGAQGLVLKCPFCGEVLSISGFETHVRRKH